MEKIIGAELPRLTTKGPRRAQGRRVLLPYFNVIFKALPPPNANVYAPWQCRAEHRKNGDFDLTANRMYTSLTDNR